MVQLRIIYRQLCIFLNRKFRTSMRKQQLCRDSSKKAWLTSSNLWLSDFSKMFSATVVNNLIICYANQSFKTQHIRFSQSHLNTCWPFLAPLNWQVAAIKSRYLLSLACVMSIFFICLCHQLLWYLVSLYINVEYPCWSEQHWRFFPSTLL